uniref:Uncharacterized protein n=1 Tax=Moniliophthora roreri TaxID=221103 RepID=A0A0W0F890_MONRR
MEQLAMNLLKDADELYPMQVWHWNELHEHTEECICLYGISAMTTY